MEISWHEKIHERKKNSRLAIKFSTRDKNIDMKKKSRLELKYLNLNKKDLDLN